MEADDLDPRAGLKESFIKRVHVAAIVYMRGAAVDFPADRQAMVVGMCSTPDPDELFRTLPQPQSVLVWYQLAELEAEVSQGHEVLLELRKRTGSGALLPMETTLVTRVAGAAIRYLDVDSFLEALKTFPRAAVERFSKMREWSDTGDIFNQPRGHLEPIAESEWKDDKIARATKSAVLSFMLVCGARGQRHVLDDFCIKIRRVPGLSQQIDPLLRLVDEPSREENDGHVNISSIVGRLFKAEEFDANDAFLSSAYIIQFIEGSPFSLIISQAMMSFYEVSWPEILEKRAFSMRSPSTNGPYILEAMNKGDTAIQRMANMVLASEAAAKRNLSTAIRERIARIAAKRATPGRASDELS